MQEFCAFFSWSILYKDFFSAFSMHYLFDFSACKFFFSLGSIVQIFYLGNLCLLVCLFLSFCLFVLFDICLIVVLFLRTFQVNHVSKCSALNLISPRNLRLV